MKQVLPGLAKRTLAFMLAFVLLLSLVPSLPLAANAEVQTDGWEYNTSYQKYYKTAEFISSDADLVFENDQAYDWEVKFGHSYTSSLSPTITATVTDANGNQIGDKYETTGKLTSGSVYTVLRASDFPALTTNLAGTFKVVMEIYNGSTFMARMTKTFSREIAVSIESSVSSRSNPDKAFTFADPIDLVLNIKQTSGVAAAYNAAVTVTNASGSELLAARGLTLPASTNIVLSVKDLVDLPAITTAGAYKVNLTLTDSKGATQHQSSHSFSVVALKDNLTATITSPTSANMVFNDVTPDIVLNLQKTDGLAESFNAHILITNEKGATALNGNFTANVPATGTATITPGMGNVKAVDTYTVVATITDDAGNYRGTATATFTIKSGTPMTCTVTNNSPSKTGNIYYNESGSDISMRIAITHKASANQTVTIKFVGTINGKECEQTITTTTLGSTGYKTVSVTGKLMPYGVYENVALAVFDSYGNELWRDTKTYSFSRIPTASDPGSLPLLNLNDHFTSKKGDAELKISLMAQTGANMWRASIPWATVEKTEGNYAMVADVKTVMDTTKANGMQALILLAYGNDDIYGTPNPTDSTWLNAYANYCYYVAEQMAKYYPDQVVAFEIWNEWNHASMSKVPATYRTGAHYATVVKAASAKIRAVNAKYGTDFKVIAGATAGDGYGDSTSNTFIKAMFAASGFFDAIDGVSFHTYSSEETTSWSDQLKGQRTFAYISPAEHDFAARIVNYKNLMAQYNAPSDLEVWITETGWTTNEEPESGIGSTDGKTHITYGADEVDAAGYLVQLYAWALYEGSVDRIFWYDFMNDISNQTGTWGNNLTESNYGLIHNWNNSGDQPLAYSAKAGYVTMCALSSKLGGASNGKQIHINNDSNIFAYQFSKDGKYITVMWAEGNSKTVNLTLSKDITVSDMYGNATTYKAGSVTLTLTGAPIYLEYASGAISFG